MKAQLAIAATLTLLTATTAATAGTHDAGAPGPSAAAMEALFHRATDAMLQGRPADAAKQFVSLADQAPGDLFADDALFSAAQLYEEQLRDPARAADLYRRLLERYPDSRTSLAATRRLEALSRDLGPDRKGAVALAAFNDILQRYPERGETESIRLMNKIITDHPSWVGIPRALIWLGTVHDRVGRYRLAIERYLEVTRRWPGTEEALDGFRGAGYASLTVGEFDDAERYFRAMRDPEDPARARTYLDAMKRLRTARLRAKLYIAAQVIVVLALFLLLASLRLASGSWRGSATALLPPPSEIIYMLPIAAVLSAASFTAHYAIAPAVVIVCASGLVFTWLSGAGLRAIERPSLARAAGHAVVCFAAIVSLSYIALHRHQLLDMLIETVRFGPDV